jgi:hypothetical protein
MKQQLIDSSSFYDKSKMTVGESFKMSKLSAVCSQEQHEALLENRKKYPLEKNYTIDDKGNRVSLSHSSYEYIKVFTKSIENLVEGKPVHVRGKQFQTKLLLNEAFAKNFIKQKNLQNSIIRQFPDNTFAIAY